eukprot:TRINITY_DN2148_c0_g1_i1.p1 TRINITY_DN2148_c0_g1~~TRINITY_DN2148_c0_g1_i1.p1  ORF type:complete len:330 (+),score=56.04 TRINITY_DN2148_c0_g1_i1:231-1220(+)
MAFSEEQNTSILAVRLTMSCLTILGSLFIMTSMIIFKRFHRLSARLIWWMSITALITGISNLLSPAKETEWVCIFQGIIMQWSQQGTLLWTCMIALNLYILVFARQLSKNVRVEKYEKYYHLFVWLVCTLFTVLPATTNCYGIAGVWCWIEAEPAVCTGWRFACFYIPLFIYMAWVAYVYIHVAIEVRSTFHAAADMDAREDKKRRRKDSRMIKKLVAYPIIFFVLWLPAAIQRIQNWVDPENPIFWLVMLQVITAPSQGFVNAVAYGFDRDLRHRYVSLLKCESIKDDVTVGGDSSRTSGSLSGSGREPSTVSQKKNFSDLFSCLFVW